MFRGQLTHSVDAKGRMSLPVRFRDQLTGAVLLAFAGEKGLPALETVRVAMHPSLSRRGHQALRDSFGAQVTLAAEL